jgi:hypothetical protein
MAKTAGYSSTSLNYRTSVKEAMEEYLKRSEWRDLYFEEESGEEYEDADTFGPQDWEA